MAEEEIRYYACIPVFSTQGYPIEGRNGTVNCIPPLSPFFAIFPPEEIHWAYRVGRTEENKIPPIVDLPKDFVPGWAIFSWTFPPIGLFVNVDERGIFIGDSNEQYCITSSDSGALLPSIQLVLVPIEKMAEVATQIFMKFFPQGLPPNLH